MIKEQFTVPLYFHSVEVISTNTIEDIVKEHELNIPRGEFGAVTFKRNNIIYMVFNEVDISPSLIAHECLHCMDYIFQDIGYIPEQDNQEPANHLLGFLVEKCHEIINQ